MTPKMGMIVGIAASVGLVVVIGGGLAVMKMSANSIGSPTQATQGNVLNKITMDLKVSKLVTPPPATGTGAEAAYQEAVKAAAGMGDNFIVAVKETQEPEKDPAMKKILDKLEEAADKGLGTADLNFDATLPLTPAGEWHLRDTLAAIGTVAAKSGMSRRTDKDKAGSEKALRAGLIWGNRLFQNGAYVAYKSAGLGCVSESLAEYESEYSKRFFDDPLKLAAERVLKDAYEKAAGPWDVKEKLVRKLNPISAPGDLWNLAENDKDRAWQLDGLMWLGPAKWTEADGAQRAAIQKYLENKAGSSDPLIAKRAKAAADMSRADVKAFRPE